MTASPVVTFDYDAWTGMYPEFRNCTLPQAQNWFNQAGLYCRNEPNNPANRTEGVLATLLYMVTAHIGWLNAPRDGSGNPSSSGSAGSPLVGQITDATEGSVNVSVQNDYPPGTPQWFQQTKYGAAYWAATAQYRTMRYRPPAGSFGGPAFPFARWPWPGR